MAWVLADNPELTRAVRPGRTTANTARPVGRGCASMSRPVPLLAKHDGLLCTRAQTRFGNSPRRDGRGMNGFPCNSGRPWVTGRRKWAAIQDGPKKAGRREIRFRLEEEETDAAQRVEPRPDSASSGGAPRGAVARCFANSVDDHGPRAADPALDRSQGAA